MKSAQIPLCLNYETDPPNSTSFALVEQVFNPNLPIMEFYITVPRPSFRKHSEMEAFMESSKIIIKDFLFSNGKKNVFQIFNGLRMPPSSGN